MSKMNKTRGEAEEKAQDLMEYMDYNVDNTDEMIKMEKFRESKEVVDNGVRRNLHKDEVVQLNKCSECSIIFMEGTFKSCPKSYQLYNIMGKEKNTGLIIPLIFILMSHKSYDIYYYVFKFIKTII